MCHSFWQVSKIDFSTGFGSAQWMRESSNKLKQTVRNLASTPAEEEREEDDDDEGGGEEEEEEDVRLPLEGFGAIPPRRRAIHCW